MSHITNWASSWWPPIGDRMPEKLSITEFLLARIAEDEQYAYHALGLLGLENPWWTWANLKARFESLSRADAQHIERHGPRRVMAECAAKRAIIEQWDDPAFSDQGAYDAGHARAMDDAVRALAAVYSNHPEYQSEWSMS